MLHKPAGRLIAGVALLGIVLATLTPDFAAGRQEPSLCIICGRYGGEDALLNVLLFIPFGFGLRLRGTDRLWAWGATIATTVTIETLQIVIPGRDPSLGDVVMNSLGGIIGILLCDSWQLWVFPSAAQARSLLMGGAMVWLSLVALGSWAMKPWVPNGPLLAQIAPDLKDIELFEGKVLDARLDGEAFVPNTWLGTSKAIHDSTVSGQLTLQARVVPAGPTYDLAPIVSIGNRDEAQIIVLGQAWRDAVLRVRLRSGELRMRIPEVAALRVFPPRSASDSARGADTIELCGRIVAGKKLLIASSSKTTRQSAALVLSPFLLWSLASPGDGRRGPRAFEIESIIWVAALLAPLGYWAGRWKRQARGSDMPALLRRLPEATLAAANVAGLALVPLVFGFAVAPPALWVTGAAASVLALLVGGVRATGAS